ncbi:glycerate kinase, partial [Bifidobacterium longum]
VGSVRCGYGTGLSELLADAAANVTRTTEQIGRTLQL